MIRPTQRIAAMGLCCLFFNLALNIALDKTVQAQPTSHASQSDATEVDPTNQDSQATASQETATTTESDQNETDTVDTEAKTETNNKTDDGNTAATAPTTNPTPPPASTPPAMKTDAQAVYPPKALTDRIRAKVVLEIEINEEGLIDSSSVVSSEAFTEDNLPVADSTAYDFIGAAQVAASQLVFEPATVEGAPITVRVNYTFTFALPPKQDPTEQTTTANTEKNSSPSVVNFRGQILERGTRKKLTGITITVFRDVSDVETIDDTNQPSVDATQDTAAKQPQGFEATTDVQGIYKLYDLEPGEWNILISQQGYFDIQTEETITSGESLDITYYLEKKSYNPYDVTIEAERPRKEVVRRTLTSAEIVNVPGTLGDPVLVIENLPGVARSFGELIVRGSGPEDTGVYVDGIEIPLIYHFGGLKSVLPAKIVDSIDFYPGNFSAQYGRALGGIFDAHVKLLKPDRIHGSADISLLDTSLYLEVPLGDKAAIAIAGRRSYIDFILNAAIPEDSDVGLIQAPRYYDYQLLGNWRPKPAHDFRFLFLGSDDRLQLLFDGVSDSVALGPQSGSASIITFFNRATAEYNYTPSKKFKNRLKFGAGRDVIDFDIFDRFRLDIRSWRLQLRDTATWTLNDNIKINAGIDSLVTITSGVVNAPTLPPEGEGDPDFDQFLSTSFTNRVDWSLAPFVEGELQFDKLRVVPGMRFDYFERADKVTFDPRLLVRWDEKKWAVKGGVGIVHQDPPPRESQEGFGNPDIDIQKAVQYSLGAEWRPKDHLIFDVTLFYKDLDNLVASSDEVVLRNGEPTPLVLDNTRIGRVYGGEIFAKHNFANNFRGWVSYTLSRAERKDEGETDYRRFDYDQTHILAVVASYLLPKNWELGLRWRVVTGNPTTPVVGAVFDDRDDKLDPVLGAVNSDRLPSFQQLDLRVDKTWVYDKWQLSAYLSLINAYNHQNVEAVDYNYDFTEKANTTGLPILPIFGVKGEW